MEIRELRSAIARLTVGTIPKSSKASPGNRESRFFSGKVLFLGDGEQLILRAFSSDVLTEVRIQSDIKVNAVLNGKYLGFALKGLPGTESFTMANHGSEWVRIGVAGQHFDLAIDPSMTSDVMALDLHVVTGPSGPKVKMSDIGKMYQLRSFAANMGEIRECLTNVFFNKKAQEMVATDGHVLGLIKCEETAFERNLMIRPSALAAIRKLVGKADECGVMFVPETEKVVFYGEDYTLVARNAAGAVYPPYKKVIPELSGETLGIRRSLIEEIPYSDDKVALRVEGGSITYSVDKSGYRWSASHPHSGSCGSIAMLFASGLLRQAMKYVGDNEDSVMLKLAKDDHPSHTAVIVHDDTGDKMVPVMPAWFPEEIY